MPYDPVEDIPNIETFGFDVRKVHPLMRQVVTTARIALNHGGNFRKRRIYEKELRSYLRNQLLMAVTTEINIQTLLRFNIRKDFPPAVVDAASLTREQIEKIFSIALVSSNPPQMDQARYKGNQQSFIPNDLSAQSHITAKTT